MVKDEIFIGRYPKKLNVEIIPAAHIQKNIKIHSKCKTFQVYHYHQHISVVDSYVIVKLDFC